ncbi:hypothetical protein ACO0LD_18630 [Undibacterium sp. Ji83W]|uniref:hypothetical protein n=1 Tax=Undibacterium sp. Ji83W TaxID=3413043 RepID=UPI003BF00F5B
MSSAKYIFVFFFVGIFMLPGQVLTRDGDIKNKKVQTLKDAEKISIDALVRYSHKKAELFSCTLIEERRSGFLDVKEQNQIVP